MSSINTRQKSLDGLRGLAILLVLLVHFFAVIPEELSNDFTKRTFTYGSYGVHLFFILSGFLITGILIDNKGKENYFKNFYARRILRIFPIYYLFIAFTFLYPYLNNIIPILPDGLLNATAPMDNFLWYFFYLSNILFFINKGFIFDGFLHVTWTLAIEEQFYLIWPLIVNKFSLLNLKKVCLYGIFISILSKLILYSLGCTFFQVLFFTICRFDELLMGALFAVLIREKGKELDFLNKHSTLSLTIFSFLMFIFHHIIVYQNHSIFLIRITGILIVDLCLFSIFIKAYFNTPIAKAIFENRFMTTLGKYSYSMYLFHIAILWSVVKIFFPKGLDLNTINIPLSIAGYAILGFSLTFLFSLFTWNLIEKKTLEFKKYFEY